MSPINEIAISGSYAFVAAGERGLRVIDVSDPTKPREVGHYDELRSASAVCVDGSHAFVGDAAGGVWALDVSDTSQLRRVAFLDTPRVLETDCSHPYAYVATTDGLLVIDIAAPTLPSIVASADIHVDSAYIHTDAVFLSGSYAYLASAGLQVLDITNPMQPTPIALRNALSHPEFESYTFDLPEEASPYRICVSESIAYALTETGLHVIGLSQAESAASNGGPLLELESKANVDIPGAYDLAVSGSLVYVADGATLRMMDLTDPANPKAVGSYTTPGYVSGVFLSYPYLYAVTLSGGHGRLTGGATTWSSALHVLNVSDPAKAEVVGSRDIPGSAQTVFVAGSYAYVGTNDGLEVLDISNLANPLTVGSWNGGGVTVVTDVFVAGSYAYVASYVYSYDAEGGAGLRILDIRDPTAPYLVGRSGLDIENMFVSGDYAYVSSGGQWGGFSVVDISNPAFPQAVASCTGCYTPPAYIGDLFVSGPYVYALYYDYPPPWGGGFVTLDVSVPSAPREVSYFDVGEEEGLGYRGAMSKSGSYVYLLGDNGTLRVVDVSAPANPREIATYDLMSVLPDTSGALTLDGRPIFDATQLLVSDSYIYTVSQDWGLLIFRLATRG